MKQFLTGLAVLCVCCGVSAAEVKLTPVADVSLLGGQYYLDDDPSSFGGNISAYFSPVVNFSPKNAFVPVFNIDYRGTQDIDELVGGGTLTQQSLDAQATLKYVRAIGSWSSKLRFGYKQSYVNETEDENWGEGLFDYSRLLFGLEMERKISGYDFSFAADYYTLAFGNYSSLVSQSEDEFSASIDTTTYTEISENAGENVLDYNNLAFSVEAQKKFSASLTGSAGYRIDLRNYADQSIVQKDGSFSSGLRKDTVHTIDLGIEYKYKRSVLGLSNETGIFSSNQNSYDADAAKFTENYYSYYYTDIMPSYSLYIGAGENLSRLKFWWDLELRKYNDRLAQDDDADYLSDKVVQSDNSFGMSYSYPVADNMLATLQMNRRIASSNMKYEGNYKYNYTVLNYYIGLNWQY